VQQAQQSVHLIAATVGFISFFLIWLAIVWGLVLRNGWASTRIRHSTAYGIHQTLALLGLCLAVVHAGAQLAAPLGTVTLMHEFVPFINPSDPVGIGVGVVGLEMMVAAALSILIQRKLGYSRWRALHSMTYVAFMLVVAHVLISGTDTGPVWVWGSVMGAWLSTVALWFTTTTWMRSGLHAVADRFSVQRRAAEVTVDVDAVRCARFGFCEHEAPDVFQLRSDGRLSYSASVPAENLDAVVRAMRVCPARAISVGHAPTLMMKTPKKEPGPPPPTRPRKAARSNVTGLHRGPGSPTKGSSW
jgi:ferredoxin/DMSO/TMAO reductase YedYZ heme-binding membrane subunit